MRGIPTFPTGYDGEIRAGISLRQQPVDADASSKETTLQFTGFDGKLLSFVKSPVHKISPTAADVTPVQQSTWDRRFVSYTKSEDDTKSVKRPLETPNVESDCIFSAERHASPKRRAGRHDIAIPLSQHSGHKDPSAQELEDYLQKEDEFMLKQEIEKSKVRLNDGRGDELDCLLSPCMPFDSAHVLFKTTDTSTLKRYTELLNAHLYFAKDEDFIAFIKAIRTIIDIRLLADSNSLEVGEFVVKKIDTILENKTIEELEGYETEIKKNLNSDTVVDTNFWEYTLSRIPFFKACCIITEYKRGTLKIDSTPRAPLQSDIKESSGEATTWTDPAYDNFMKSLQLDEDELLVEQDVPYGNSDGLKPRFIVRITMGFEWNKYNQSHYHPDNPPPKHVRGFKFILFFSHQEDSRTTPKWKLVKDGDSTDTCLIVFKGGRPYSPIAFRIPSREWDTDSSKGFKNYFSNGVLHLYFTFRKLSYRR